MDKLEDRNVKVLKKFEPFILGFCKCGCGTEISVRSQTHRTLQQYVQYHHSKGANNWKWKGRMLDKDGYTLIKRPFHPYTDTRGYVRHHRLVIEQYLTIKFGIPIYLLPYFVVHHKDNNKQNNVLSNLEILTKRQHDSLPRLDMTNRKCILCNKGTYIDKEGQPRWYRYEDGHICSVCNWQVKSKLKKFKQD
ncbi:MAG: HNH endonuclease [Candidatus Nitrosocosmicus sp.]|nr:HNH endonuclease [Candidatus Nitrosocosmicus sp.]